MGSTQNYKISKKDMEQLKKKEARQQGAEEAATPVSKIVLRVIGALIAVGYLGLLFFGGNFLPKDGEFLSSLNPFSKAENVNHIIRIVSICILTMSISVVLRYFIGRMAANKSVTKKTGVAIIELLANLVKYITYIILICLLLSALGVDTTGILAGLGIVTMIIGLGVTSLIEDIVAGIFIITERLFDVGDIVVVDGFRGTVVSIGIRSTKFADVGGDIMIMRNSSIGSLVNLTERVSCAAITLPLAPKESFQRVDALLKTVDWESIGAKYPMMKSGPMYLGLCEITAKGAQMLLFIAGCLEENRYDVERDLYKELKAIFENNNIELGVPVFSADET